MKKYILNFVSMMLLLLCACSEEQLPEGSQLSLEIRGMSISAENFAFPYKGGSYKLSINSNNTEWEINGLPEWLSASTITGKGTATVTLTAQENKSVDVARVAVITVCSTNGDFQYSKAISVIQPKADIFITPKTSSITFNGGSATKSVAIESNIEWAATCDKEWVKLEKVNNELLNIFISENTSASRSATVTLSHNSSSIAYGYIVIMQGESGVTSSQETINFSPDGETKTTEINADASWTAYSSDPSWLSVKPGEGQHGNTTLSVTATANGSTNLRTGFVYVRIGTKNKLSIPINQEGLTFKVNKNSISFISTGGCEELEVIANGYWEVVSHPDWVGVNITKGNSGKTELSIEAKDNPDATSLEGNIEIGRPGLTGNIMVKVNQEGKSFSDPTSDLEFPNTVATQTIDIITDGTWTATKNADWININPTSGIGNGKLQVSVDANPDKDSRKGEITVTVGHTSKKVSITQVGRYLNLSLEGAITDSKPCKVDLSVTSNVDWEVSSNYEWIRILSPTKGSGDAAVTIELLDNPSKNQRDGLLVFTTTDGTKTFKIVQPGRKLSVDCIVLEFEKEGGRKTITITTDGEYEIIPSDNWIKIIPVITLDGSKEFEARVSVNDSISKREGSIKVALTDLENNESLSCTISVSQKNITNHTWVDLGLSVRWATTNIGASTEGDYGYTIAWGETYPKNNYSFSNYKYYLNGDEYSITKYCTSSKNGIVDNKTQLDLTDDVARVRWGGKWRMPTFDELIELSSKCTWTVSTRDGHKGFLVTGPNGNSIFLPAAGWESINSEYRGYYWSSSLNQWPPCANYLFFDIDDSEHHGDYTWRSSGFSVRPVTE